jgi:hypothetical protein
VNTLEGSILECVYHQLLDFHLPDFSTFPMSHQVRSYNFFAL